MFARFCMWVLNSLGWTIRVDFPDIDKYVVIAAPHTSNWDFPLGILASRAVKLDVSWLGKHTLFRWPFGWFFRAIGGTPVRREQGLNLIQQMTQLFASSDHLILALAPEGTRRKTNHWKTGFYHIARSANVPIVMAYLDFGRKEVGISEAFYTGDDIEADFQHIRGFYAGKQGKHPQKASLISVRPRGH